MTAQPTFNPPPGWPKPPHGWRPPSSWTPDPSWPPAPEGWEFWINTETGDNQDPTREKMAEQPRPPELWHHDGSVSADTPVERTSDAEMSEELAQLRTELRDARIEIRNLKRIIESSELIELDDELALQSVGIYRYHHPLENADDYKERLTRLNVLVKEMVKAGTAIEASSMFTFDNSLAKGRRMTSDLSKLMLRAYNAEADNCIRTLRAGNLAAARKRLEAAAASIARLGSTMEMHISDRYHDLRLEELELTADFLMKVEEDREAAKEERARLREERKAEQELAAERERLEKERAHLVNALTAVLSQGGGEETTRLQAKVSEIDEAIALNDYRVANIRAGYVYVVSNRGSFGRHVVKIGLTRRLDPMDRVRELGDASVPFPFDVHAIFFSEDAVTLESELHQEFAGRRMNQVNMRREFFFATPEGVHEVLQKKVGNLLEFVEKPESAQYLQSRGSWPTEHGY